MKKRILLTLCFVAIAAIGAFAQQKVVLPQNSEGKICYTNEYTTSSSQDELFQNVSLWIVSAIGTDAIITKDQEKGEIVANCSKQAKSSYNPFSGAYNEFVSAMITFNVSDGKIKYTMERPSITGIYVGYGSRKTVTDMNEKYDAYVTAYQEKEAIEKDESLSKKERKSQLKEKNELIEDMEDSLFEAGKSLTEITEMIESGLFK